MAATALVAARVEPELKGRARAVLEREGMTESLFIRRVCEYIVFLDEVPEVIKTGEYAMGIDSVGDDKFEELSFLIGNGPLAELDFSGLGTSGYGDAKADALEGKFGYGFMEAHAYE